MINKEGAELACRLRVAMIEIDRSLFLAKAAKEAVQKILDDIELYCPYTEVGK